MLIGDLATPALLIDKSRLEFNLLDMQKRAEDNNVRLRPHTKTHKSVAIAKWQREKGASGLTVAKLGEAETYAEAGFEDIRLAYALVGDDKYERLLALMDSCNVSFCVDTVEGARAASSYFSKNQVEVDVMIETDVGYGRCGVRYDKPSSLEFARYIDTLPGLKVRGILTHAGHAYGGPKVGSESKAEALKRVSEEERDRMLEFAVELRKAEIDAAIDGTLEISIGSTPSLRYFSNKSVAGFSVTEIRPGNYVFLDMVQVNLGVEPIERCALTVYATVISKHGNPDMSERFFLDSGKKVLTSDKAMGSDSFGQILGNARDRIPMPDVQINALSEEHGWVRVAGKAAVDVLDRVQVVPNHACVVVNTQRHMYVVDGEQIVEQIEVDAQSKVA